MGQFWIQLLLGGAMTGVSIAVQAVFIGIAWRWRPHVARRIGKLPLGWMTVVLAVVAVWMLAAQMFGVWLWAGLLIWVGAFDAKEPALYYTLSSYTTVGFGDVLPPKDWRILGSVIAANGMIGFGLATAALVEYVNGIRLGH